LAAQIEEPAGLNAEEQGINLPKEVEVGREDIGLLDLVSVLTVSIEELTKSSSAKAFTAVMEDLDMEAMQKRDALTPEIATSMRTFGSEAKVQRGDSAVTFTTDGVGKLMEANTGNQECDIFEHYWYNPRHINSTAGSYRTKALLALKAEDTSFDVSFYRMQRRDAEQVQGYLVAHLNKEGNPYVSFLQEALSHMVLPKVKERTLLMSQYGMALKGKGEYRVRDAGTQAFTVEERGLGIDRTKDPVEVREHPDFGILWEDPATVGPPGHEAEIKFVPADLAMSTQMGDGFMNQNQDFFVSRAKSACDLAKDILAAYAGSREEFGIYGKSITMVLATMVKRDFDSILDSWELRRDLKGDLRDLAHWLRYRRGYVSPETMLASKADFLRCRDYMALSNTLHGRGAEWRRSHNLDGEAGVGLPYASWQARMCKVYNILEYTGEETVVIRGWDSMRTLALIRGIDLGALIDYSCQTTVGSVRNLVLFPGERGIELTVKLALAFVTNTCYSVSRQQTCFRFEFLNGKVATAVGAANSTAVIDTYTSDEPSGVVLGEDRWWLETRCTWEGCQTPEVDYLIKTKWVEDSRSEVVRFGNNVIISHKSEVGQNNRTVSLLDKDDLVRYQFRSRSGRQNYVIYWTNDRLPPHFVHWNAEIDKILTGEMSSNRLGSLRRRAIDVSVGFNSATMGGEFDGMAAFTGFSDF